jgi:hypothetical protein
MIKPGDVIVYARRTPDSTWSKMDGSMGIVKHADESTRSVKVQWITCAAPEVMAAWSNSTHFPSLCLENVKKVGHIND